MATVVEYAGFIIQTNVDGTDISAMGQLRGFTANWQTGFTIWDTANKNATSDPQKARYIFFGDTEGRIQMTDLEYTTSTYDFASSDTDGGDPGDAILANIFGESAVQIILNSVKVEDGTTVPIIDFGTNCYYRGDIDDLQSQFLGNNMYFLKSIQYYYFKSN